jgi:D-serine deaminase-like pyridoxal phosphate-dependent protein
MPTVLSHPGLRVKSLSAEHTIFEFDIESPPTLALGDHVHMIPPYSDSAMILHHDVYAVRDGVVEDIWSLGDSIGRTQ